jgi:hypothetical protein
MPIVKMYIGLWSNMRKKSERNYSFKSLSSMTIRMFGASFGSRCGISGHFMVESCSRGLATPALGLGANGRTVPSSGAAAKVALATRL